MIVFTLHVDGTKTAPVAVYMHKVPETISPAIHGIAKNLALIMPLSEKSLTQMFMFELAGMPAGRHLLKALLGALETQQYPCIFKECSENMIFGVHWVGTHEALREAAIPAKMN